MNKKKNLKPAFILCAVMAIAIIAIFYSAGKVNKTVAEKLKGRLIYSTKDKNVMYLHDFDEDKEYTLKNVEEAVLYSETELIVVPSDKEGIYTYNITDGNFSLLTEVNGKLIDMAYGDEVLIYACKKNASYTIYSYDISDKEIKEEVTSDNEITDICVADDGDIYYVTNDNNKYYVMTSDDRVMHEDDAINNISVCNGNLLYDMNNNVYIYNIKRDRTDTPSFVNKYKSYTCLMTVHDRLYIVNQSDDTNEIYVCNGTNMDKIEKLSQTKEIYLKDYCEKCK